MIRYSCDLCGKELLPGEEERYVIKIEASAAHDPAELTEADLDDDNLEEISELLRALEENDGEMDLPEPTRHFRYDLCPECHRKFVRDPLGRECSQKVSFSEN
jgi:hypothetical protein